MSACSKLGLGTAQFGMRYGVVNRLGRVREDEVKNILALCRNFGIRVLDTAPAYSRSESTLGPILHGEYSFRVVTKTPVFPGVKFVPSDIRLLRDTFEISLERLQLPAVYGLIVHHGADILRPGAKTVWKELQDLKDLGLVARVGVSVYEPDELDRILQEVPIDLVQLPLNILDQRFQQSGLLRQLHQAGIETHTRSVFLQGILATGCNELPKYFAPILPRLKRLNEIAEENGLSILQLALRFVLQIEEVNVVLVGVESSAQLEQIIGACHTNVPDSISFDDQAISESCWINPSEWKLS